ncbi:MAG: hypothetical protein JNL34_02465 [Anaerolineae bacterium]|nr:hypothetical protein [Anaerolineae bacterium]
MTDILLSIHSVLRWVVLAFAILALVINVLALVQKRDAGDPLVKNGMRLWTILLDVQWLVGLLLLLVMGVFGRPQLEHAFANTLAVVVAHSAVAFRKKSDQTRLIANIATIVLALLIIIVAVAAVGGWS